MTKNDLPEEEENVEKMTKRLELKSSEELLQNKSGKWMLQKGLLLGVMLHVQNGLQIGANKSKSSRQTNVHEHVDFIPSVQAAQHTTRPPLSNAQQLLGTHYQHWRARDGLNLLPTYGMDVPTMQIYAPMLQPTQDAVFGARDESVRSNLPSKN
ncbi:Uncharacterized protein Fot_42871 [Forsythia ovata]|uniref:Uncharacterized protein n=1 Tax=Forsythia ovata TaxID=205694 RepID=A0ABD1RRA9_9LAMI